MVSDESFLSSLSEGERVSLLEEPLGGQINSRDVSTGTWSTGKWSWNVPRHVTYVVRSKKHDFSSLTQDKRNLLLKLTWSVGGGEQVQPLGQGEGGRMGEEGTE